MLNLIQLQHLDGTPNIVGRTPLANMGLEPQARLLRALIERGEQLNGLDEFVTGEVEGLKTPSSSSGAIQ